jgi:Zn-finger nucleic acid-binding protein
MTCPACSRELREATAGVLVVDVCDGGCGGIWFDAGELRRVDEAHEPVDGRVLDIERDSALVVDHDARRACPRCPEATVLMRRFTSVDRRVAVDECPGCGGVWLDAGELAEVRSEYPTAEARAQAAGERLEAAFGEWMAGERKAAERDQKTAQELRDRLRGLTDGGRGGGLGDLGNIGSIADGIGFVLL